MSLTAQQQIERRSGLGASECAAAVGLSKWETPLQLWRKKLGLDRPDEREELHLEMGQALEPMILNRFEKKQKVKVIDRQLRIVDPAWPQRWVTLDGRSATDGAHVEAKSVGMADPAEWGEEFQDDAVPMQYFLQCQHGLACNPDAPYAWLPLVVLNRQFRIYRIRRDDELIAMLTEQERAFLALVESKTPPPPIDLDDTKLMWPSHRENKQIEASIEVASAVGQLKVCKAQAKELDEKQEKFKLAIQAHMGDAAELIFAGRTIATWKKAKDSQKFDVEQFAIDKPLMYEQYCKPVTGSRRLLTK